jgi:GNAT superfamily N-acetyltransferase
MKRFMTTGISVRKEDPQGDVATRLVGELSAEIARRYSDLGQDGSGGFSPNDVLVPRSAFVVARLNGEPVGCGALRPMDAEAAEVKRMFVAAEVRGQGIGKAILTELERLAGEFGYRVLRLETAGRQPEAIALYERYGFQRIPPFGKYVHSPISICYEKIVGQKVVETTPMKVTPYKARAIRFLELWHVGDWRMKVYGIAYEGERPRAELVEAAKDVATERLRSVPASMRHYSVGFVGVHDGRTSNFVFVDWWADENELHHHVYVSPAEEPTRLSYITPTGLTACVWDLRVMGFERQAWLETVLKNSSGADVEAYLERRLNEDV